MDTKRLMVGDWVTIIDNDLRIYKNIQISQIVKYEDDYGVMGDGRSLIYFDDTIHPIALTPEILELNGFVLKGDLYEKDYVAFRFEQGNEYSWLEVGNGHTTLQIEYENPERFVHEIQQALRLCGRDDMADNFKVE